ncbi:hypothetical protein [Moorena producens]|uniref:hypothetical protein n=1 Tax=Moorena producens TaxID=1155739 RepID=UPI003C74389E
MAQLSKSVRMVPLSRYWEILRLDPASVGCGYKKLLLPLAWEFFQQKCLELDAPETRCSVRGSVGQSPRGARLLGRGTRPSVAPLGHATGTHLSVEQHRDIQTSLYAWFHPEASGSPISRARAGLCLRCYVSYPILKACKKLASLYSASHHFTYRDLLPFVLDDDGKVLIILDQDGITQLILNGDRETKKTDYQFFTVEVLRKYNLNSSSKSRLDDWVYYQTKQHPKLKEFLSERGLCFLSDWALLNRARPTQLEQLLPRDRKILEAFHAVYRRDRRQQPTKKARRCPDPTQSQLEEMRHLLQEKSVIVNSLAQLRDELKHLARVLRRYDIWIRSGFPPSESLEVSDSDTGRDRELPDQNFTNTLDAIARQELQQFCGQQLIACLDLGIEQGLTEHITKLQHSRSYARFASKVISGLELIYCHGKSQAEIASILGMTNQSQVSRVLNPKDLLNRVRFWTIDKLFHIISHAAHQFNLANMSRDPDYFRNLMEHLEAFVDSEVFQEAAAEIMTGKNRSTNSLYTQRLCRYLETLKQENHD